MGKEALSALAGAQSSSSEDTGDWLRSLSKRGCSEGGMLSADLKDQLPCQKMGVGRLPTGRPGAGDSRQGKHGEGVSHQLP